MKFKRSMNVAFTCAVSFALAIICIVIPTSLNAKSAYADITSVNNYVEAKAYLASVRAEYDACMTQATDLYNQIESTTNLTFEAQKKMAESRLNLGSLVKYEYTNSTQFSIIMTIACSTSLDDLFKNMDYANSVMDYQYRVAQEQKTRQDEFNLILNELNKQNEAQNSYLALASSKLSEATEVLNAAKSKLTPAELAELEGEISDIGGGGGDTPEPGPTPPGPAPGPGWASGIASAYGGSSDPYTPNPGITATGEVCDDWSTGVAIPTAWPDFRQYFHHTVQIS